MHSKQKTQKMKKKTQKIKQLIDSQLAAVPEVGELTKKKAVQKKIASLAKDIAKLQKKIGKKKTKVSTPEVWGVENKEK